MEVAASTDDVDDGNGDGDSVGGELMVTVLAIAVDICSLSSVAAGGDSDAAVSNATSASLVWLMLLPASAGCCSPTAAMVANDVEDTFTIRNCLSDGIEIEFICSMHSDIRTQHTDTCTLTHTLKVFIEDAYLL